MTELVQRTAGLSGSDLKELCRNAAMIPIREYVRSVQPATTSEDASQDLIDLDVSVSSRVLLVNEGFFINWISIENQYTSIDSY
jgi:SpoVK/Ycf46/Vps4 family AAA+-type ATPase